MSRWQPLKLTPPRVDPVEARSFELWERRRYAWREYLEPTVRQGQLHRPTTARLGGFIDLNAEASRA